MIANVLAIIVLLKLGCKLHVDASSVKRLKLHRLRCIVTISIYSKRIRARLQVFSFEFKTSVLCESVSNN